MADMKTSENYSPNPFWPELGEEFFDKVKPARFPKAIPRFRNQEWAKKVGLDSLSDEEWKKAFWAFEPLPQNLPEPLALRYHGHQFMSYNPDLGDGRGFLFAQLRDPQSGKNLDLGTKGSGQTPWSRRGDGRLTLKGAVREALATGLLEAFGVNTSKTFSIFETGEPLERGDEPSPTRSAVLTRLSHGHVRIGTFQRQEFYNNIPHLKKLFEFSVKHYYPDIDPKDPTAPTLFFSAVCENVARTTAQWMIFGFVHGVLNTDNVNITGESFDYGPYRFLPYYDPQFTAAYFDHSGLYAYGQQPRIMAWNLSQLAEALQMMDPAAKLDSGFEIYQDTFTEETFSLFLKRLHLKFNEDAENLFMAALHFMETSRVPFEHFFFDWRGGASRVDFARNSNRVAYYQGETFEVFYKELQKYEPISSVKENYFLGEGPIHLYIDEIERIWAKIDQDDDWSAFEAKMDDFKKLKSVLA